MSDYSGETFIQYNGQPIKLKDLPNPWLRAQLGYGHPPSSIRTRQVQAGNYPHTPDTCLTDKYSGKWLDDSVLVCTGCGLDCT